MSDETYTGDVIVEALDRLTEAVRSSGRASAVEIDVPNLSEVTEHTVGRSDYLQLGGALFNTQLVGMSLRFLVTHVGRIELEVWDLYGGRRFGVVHLVDPAVTR